MDTVLQFLPIITSIIIAILFIILKLWLTKQFDLSVKKEIQLLEIKYKSLYDNKIKLIEYLDSIFNNYLKLNVFLEANHNNNINKKDIESVFLEIKDTERKIILICSSHLKDILVSLFHFSTGNEYIEHFKFDKNTHKELKIEFENQLKYERNI